MLRINSLAFLKRIHRQLKYFKLLRSSDAKNIRVNLPEHAIKSLVYLVSPVQSHVNEDRHQRLGKSAQWRNELDEGVQKS